MAELFLGLPKQVIDGKEAITQQSFVELNCKRGDQYEAAFFQAVLAPSSALDLVIEVGAAKVIIKDINIQFDSELVSQAVYVDPTYTVGSEITVYNLNDQQAKADDVVVLAAPTVTDPGTQVAPKSYQLGSIGIGNSISSSVANAPNVERILGAGKNYLFRITNEDNTNPSRIAGIATWFQGAISVDVD